MAMPQGSGLRVAEAVRAHDESKDVPIVVVSGVGRSDAVLRGVPELWDLYLQKPVSPADVVDAIKALIAERRARDP